MMKLSLILVPLALLASSATLDSQLLELHNEVNILKMQLQDNQEDLDERMPIIENNERHSILDKINFSPELLLRTDKFHYTNGEIEGENTKITDPSHPMFGEQRRDAFSKNFYPSLFIRMRLNMST